MRILTLLALGLAVVTASTASAGAPTRASWAQGANRICRAELTKMHAVPRPAQNDYPGLVAYLDRAVAITTPYTDRIAALPRPASERKLIAQFVSIQRGAVKQIRLLQDAVRAHDIGRIAGIALVLGKRGQTSDRIARKLGAAACASS